MHIHINAIRWYRKPQDNRRQRGGLDQTTQPLPDGVGQRPVEDRTTVQNEMHPTGAMPGKFRTSQAPHQLSRGFFSLKVEQGVYGDPRHCGNALGGVFIGGIVEALFAIHHKPQPHCRMGEGHGRQGLPHSHRFGPRRFQKCRPGRNVVKQIFCFNDRALRTRPRSNVAHATTFNADLSPLLGIFALRANGQA